MRHELLPSLLSSPGADLRGRGVQTPGLAIGFVGRARRRGKRAVADVSGRAQLGGVDRPGSLLFCFVGVEGRLGLSLDI